MWFYWGFLTLGLIGYLLMSLTGDDKTVFLPGKTSHGHHQIEMSCQACHTESFGGREVLQNACINCHGEELKIADDSHPRSKFTSPRNADRVANLDARMCVTCHVEHNEEITLAMGVTLPDDFCFKCHEDVAMDRPSHKGMSFTSCADSGCHNFHDNRALYEDFIGKHLDGPDVKHPAENLRLAELSAYTASNDYPINKYPVKKLRIEDADGPATLTGTIIEEQWLETAHSQSGVNCSACHTTGASTDEQVWVSKPDHKFCIKCHQNETDGFLKGKHGMRLAQNLTAMTPGNARIPMKKTAHDKELTCVSCHRAHRFSTQHASIDACLNCHDDEHSRNYRESKHYEIWRDDPQQEHGLKGVTCATCHMPRILHNSDNKESVLVEHNQNGNLRPNEKMIRDVCMNCHGLGFSINALADRALIMNNFSGNPGYQVESVGMVKKRIDETAGKPMAPR